VRKKTLIHFMLISFTKKTLIIYVFILKKVIMG